MPPQQPEKCQAPWGGRALGCPHRLPRNLFYSAGIIRALRCKNSSQPWHTICICGVLNFSLFYLKGLPYLYIENI